MDKKASDFIVFSSWLDKVLEEELPEGIVAFNFNLYEGGNGTYDIQLIGSDEFDEDDQDWICTDFFTTGEDVCYIERTEEIKDWQEGLFYIIDIAKKYLDDGNAKDLLKSVTAIGIGFVDGDVEIIYHA